MEEQIVAQEQGEGQQPQQDENEATQPQEGKTDGPHQIEGEAVLKAEGLVKRYGRRTVVDHVNFDVKQGEIVGLLGPNGAGKTTSFYMTTGLVMPNEGHVYVTDDTMGTNVEITNFPVYKLSLIHI